VYFCTEDVSDATFVIVNAGLYYIFVEQGYIATDPTAKRKCQEYLHLCQVNLETALANLALFLPAKPESLQALLLGVRIPFSSSSTSTGMLMLMLTQRLGPGIVRDWDLETNSSLAPERKCRPRMCHHGMAPRGPAQE
jgi:hypothetical protein